MGSEQVRNALKERLSRCKRESVEMALGMKPGWLAKIINGESGITLNMLPLLLDSQDLKMVSKEKTCVNPEVARAYDYIVRKLAQERSILFEDAE